MEEGSYAYYDQVNHNNALWTCINENGTRQEPSDASSDWQKVLSGEKGDKGDKGEREIEVTKDHKDLKEKQVRRAKRAHRDRRARKENKVLLV